MALSGLTILTAAPASAAPEWQTTPVSSYDYDGSVAACAPYLFIGVRGSGEPKKNSDSPYGPTVETVANSLKALTQNVKVRQVYLDYQASPMSTLEQDFDRNRHSLFSLNGVQPLSKWNYFVSVQQGITLLKRVLDLSFNICSGQKVILAGYSQGSLVISQTLADDKYVKPANYAGVFLVADPANSPARPEIDQGSASHSALGIWSYLNGPNSVQLRSSMAGKVFSYCDEGDSVCDTNDVLAPAVQLLKTVRLFSIHPITQLKKAFEAFTLGASDFSRGSNFHANYVKRGILYRGLGNIAITMNSSVTTIPTPSTTIVSIPDAVLKQCVLNEWKSEKGSNLADVTQAQLAQLTKLECGGQLDIQALTGLEYATGLKSLSIIQYTVIPKLDLLPIAELRALNSLSVLGEVSSLAPLRGNTSIRTLSLTYGKLQTLDEIATIPNLQSGTFDHNLVTDITPLRKLYAAGVGLSIREQFKFSDEASPGKISPLPAIVGVNGNVEPVLTARWAGDRVVKNVDGTYSAYWAVVPTINNHSRQETLTWNDPAADGNFTGSITQNVSTLIWE